MLVTFQTKVYPPITMFGEVARRLLKMMGMSGEVPGALKGGDVGEALTRLRSGLARLEPDTSDIRTRDDAEEEPPVSLMIRAFPLLELLSLAYENRYDVIWRERSP
jgi:hypothetical protein